MISAPLYICHMSKPSYVFVIDYKILCMYCNKATLTLKHPDTVYYSLLNSSIQWNWHQPFLFSLPNKLQMCLLCRRQKQKTWRMTFSTAIWPWAGNGHGSSSAGCPLPKKDGCTSDTSPRQDRTELCPYCTNRSFVPASLSTTDGSYKNTV